MTRISLIAALFSLGGVIPDVASGSMIGFTAQLHTNQDHFSITNESDFGFTITDLDIFVGSDTEFDTVALTLGTLTDPGGDLMFSPILATAIVDGASTASLDFSGFDSGDIFEFNVGFLDVSGNIASGPDLNNALLFVKFSDGQTLQTTFAGGPTSPPRSNKQAFEFNAFGESAGDAEIPGTPEPSGAVLLLMGVVGLVGCAGFRRWTAA